MTRNPGSKGAVGLGFDRNLLERPEKKTGVRTVGQKKLRTPVRKGIIRVELVHVLRGCHVTTSTIQQEFGQDNSRTTRRASLGEDHNLLGKMLAHIAAQTLQCSVGRSFCFGF